MNEIEVRAPAKINLFLKILGRRDDGYHDIFSWFQAISLYDYISYEKSANAGIELRIEHSPDLPTDKTNLIVRTADLMFKNFGLSGGLKIHLKKNIPVAAGLGGGSSDSAATIYAIDKLFELGLTDIELRKLGLKIGSDIPFFFSSGQAEVTGRGDIIENIKLPLNYYIVLVNPGIFISTAESYAGLKMSLTSQRTGIKLFRCKDFKEMVINLLEIENDFEKGHLKSFPILEKVSSALTNAGARLVRMSGSGPTIYGLFENIPEGDGFHQIIRGDWWHFIVQPIVLPAWER